MQAIALGPVAGALSANSNVFMFYKGGIINSSSCGTTLNHAVLFIGYGTDSNGQDFWLLKNSWGTRWGE
jgi:KDEL-tailed cysteine endopeptidase